MISIILAIMLLISNPMSSQAYTTYSNQMMTSVILANAASKSNNSPTRLEDLSISELEKLKCKIESLIEAKKNNDDIKSNEEANGKLVIDWFPMMLPILVIPIIFFIIFGL